MAKQKTYEVYFLVKMWVATNVKANTMAEATEAAVKLPAREAIPDANKDFELHDADARMTGVVQDGGQYPYLDELD